MSQAGIASISKSGGGGLIQTIAGDTGSITGTNVTIYANNVANGAGANVAFINSGTVSTLVLTDPLGGNLYLGPGAGTAGLNGSLNTGVGTSSMGSITIGLSNSSYGSGSGQKLTSGNGNLFLGFNAGSNVLTGSNNILLGSSSGVFYTSSESNNICMSNSGVVSESNVIRIGTQGSGTNQQNTCYIAGIVGVTNSNAQLVTVNSSTGQLGVSTGGSIISTWTDVTSSTQTLATGNGYATDNAGGVTYTLPSTANLGDEIRILGKSGVATITPGTGQQIVMSTVSGTVGATGTAVGQNSGASCILQCITPGVSTVWRLLATSDNWTLT